MIEMTVAGIALDAYTRSPIVLLKDGSDRRALPICIGQDQAKSIIGALEQHDPPPRPLTHDLIGNIFDSLDLSLSKIVIHALQDSTFYALLCLEWGDQTREIDCRPSDAIAIALRTNSPIWVVEEVVAEASIPVDRDADEEERQAFRDFVADISPEDFIKMGRRQGTSES
ncbi:bifunctional nuclease family protein [Spirulina subsalsa CS-330]|jgi:bifunctional DNase/RNase|uniref:bifunctional nuclease family protein n=1 Tax=Spirulina TaxID=1154 RepID=UPI0009336F7A|nr:bifunctional nuclease family protein [Spirulina subsalsa CS-330]